ncbi:glycosyltransferase [Rubrobacter marinus]|uniref:Glycosyltransferase n=1 Tax=Rubrobacter marinus TaxID=2653852 RepID=A0A6G8Q1H4_9ACTN|nr:glycosyltransferase [Rubrobacter marinus]QIN80321.1 glycosyltransferase [Rubrobacter marinus]
MTLLDLLLAFNQFVLGYFVVLNTVYLVLYAVSFVEVADHARREIFSGLPELFASAYSPPVSVVVPAYNEEVTIASSVRSLLTMRYPLHEVVVVNDGSKDRTLEVLKETFGLREADQPVRMQLRTAPIRGVYVSPTERLIVVDKENGGRSDALNAGVCAAGHPFVCFTDADVVMEEDALLRVARPLIESENVVAVGGIVRVANGCEIRDGRVVEVRAPRNPIAAFQVVEYLRAFVASRTGWSRINSLLIVSGAFGMFRRRDILNFGGLEVDTIAEDMELTLRFHKLYKKSGSKYRVVFIPDPVAWTEVPSTLRVLGRQRDRWHRGLIETLVRYRRMIFNPSYGSVGLLGLPYFLFFEFLGPLVELAGYVALVVSLLLGVLNTEFALLFFLVSVGWGSFLSLAAVFLEELRLRRYPRWGDLGKLSLYAVAENLGYRQLNTVWRVIAMVSYLRNKKGWGEMERQGFDDPEGEQTLRRM